jgi:tetratricopeptide (TPR) repeat protein
VDEEMMISMPDLKWDSQKLRTFVKNMDSVEFWLQKGMQYQSEGKLEEAMDYYRAGLRKNPTNL